MKTKLLIPFKDDLVAFCCVLAMQSRRLLIAVVATLVFGLHGAHATPYHVNIPSVFRRFLPETRSTLESILLTGLSFRPRCIGSASLAQKKKKKAAALAVA